jgi:hypothetical protein
MPFYTNIATGGGAFSYTPSMTETSNSMIIANYGASQGFDNGARAQMAPALPVES